MSEGDLETSPGPDGAARMAEETRPEPTAVDRLIEAAGAHPLGMDYLLRGYLGSVAATFGVHAFVVEEARRLVAGEPGKKGVRDGLS